MADEEKQDKKQEEKQEQPKSKKGFLQYAILGAVVLIFAGAGFFLGRFLKGASVPATADAAGDDDEAQTDDSIPDDGKTWFFTFEPVIANLNDPGAMRYASLTLTLEMSSAAPQGKIEKLFAEKMPILTNWITIYLASLGLEDIRGDKNLKRMQAQILDALNEQVFPNQKPKIKHVLFKEFAIQ